MRKITALILCLILVLSFTVLPVSADGIDDSVNDAGEFFDAFEVMLGSADATPYTSVTLPLSILNNQGFAVMKLTLSYDTEAITLTDVQSEIDVQFTQNDGYAVVTFFSLGSDYAVSGKVADLVFSLEACSGNNEIAVTAEEGDICNNKAEVLLPQFTNGHIVSECNHIYTYIETVSASCSSEGRIVYRCNICDDELITYIDKTEHVAKDKWETVVQSDCDDEGISGLLCQYCGEILDSRSIAPLGHKYGEYTVTIEPSCEEVGVRYRDCAVCNHREVSDIAPHGHDNGHWRTTIPSDCVNSGVASRHCNECDKVLETMTTQVGEHFMSWVTTVEPTCSSEGKEEYLCVICGEEKQQSRAIDKLSHIHGEEETVSYPTCSQKGLAETKCELCGEVVASREIDELGHEKGALVVVKAPTSENDGEGTYGCKKCGAVLESVVLDKTDGKIYMNDTSVAVGETVKIPVYIENNSGFSVGIIRVEYDVKALLLKNIIAGDITDDITVGYVGEGEINVLLSPEKENFSKNGVLFYIEVALTENAGYGKIELSYDPQNDFSAENGDRVFFNLSGAKVTVESSAVVGDANGDGVVDTIDLALMKLHLAAVDVDITDAADINGDGKITTTDLAMIKILLLSN
ncbi:MAG: cohesin domain-containing protein [Acutalibacteraceae bacterium]|nr:cohesin domain-containing protein [Acutalibacteraceae bacterium]